MKKYYLILILIPNLLIAQIIISPYVVYMDNKNQFANMIVQNESDEPYEIGVSFKFGFPVSDSLGNLSMKYIDEPGTEYPSILNYVRAFPKKFILKPKQKQLIGLTIKPPQNLQDGTYWVRIVTSSTKQRPQPLLDTNSQNLNAQINFVLNQITTMLYRTGNANTGIDIVDAKYYKNQDKLDIVTSLKKLGNSPFFGDVKVSIYNSDNQLIKTDTQHTKVFYDLSVKQSFDLAEFKKGNYKAIIQVTHNEKEDVPNSAPLSVIKNNITKTLDIIID
ncbi:hypothetical protein [Rosettibacter firmus]|uniref:hypothetical protein n=1 Tax=Rosettibacter firmus TaxID=3111522 RepID=UPI00336BB622